MPAATPDEMVRLRAELAEVLQREAALRERTTHDFLELQARLQLLTAAIGERGRSIEDLQRRELAARLELEQATAHLEAFVWMLQEAEMAREKTVRQTPAGWLRALLGRGPTPTEPKTLPGDFVYHLTTSPYRLYRGPLFTLRGWAFPRDGRALKAIRARIAGREFAARTGLPAPDASTQHGLRPGSPPPGFEVTFDTPPGRHRLALEAQLDGGEWRSILDAPVWCRPAN